MMDNKAPAAQNDPKVASEIAARLKQARAEDPALDDALINRVIRHIPDRRAICEGLFNGRPVVFRMDLSGETAQSREEWAEMQRIWPHMQTGRFRIAEPIHAVPACGIQVIEQIIGTPLLQHLWQSPPVARAAFLRPGADWYRQYTAISENWQKSRVQGWIRRAGSAAARQPFAELRPHETRLLQEMQRIGGLIEGHDWRVAICHGDLHPNNLIVAGPRLTAIDTGGSSQMPIYKDMARFLVHMARRRMLPSGQICLGVDQRGLEAFIDAFDLTPAECGLFLPFMIAFEALIRVESHALPASRIKRAAQMYHDMLPDMARVGRDDPPLGDTRPQRQQKGHPKRSALD